MNMTSAEPIFVPSKFCPEADCTRVVVLLVRDDFPHSRTLRNCVEVGVPASTWRLENGSQSEVPGAPFSFVA
jgi:hypothetical protein